MKKYLLLSMLLVANYFSFSQNSQNSTGFIENKGQIAQREINKLRPDVKFKLESPNLNSYFKPTGIENYFYKEREVAFEKLPEDWKEKKKNGEQIPKLFDQYFFRFDVNFLNANENTSIEPSGEKYTKRNFYYEFCPNGITDVKEYEDIMYHNVYNQVDLHYYIKNGFLKYDFILHAGANINDIQLQLDGAKDIQITSDGKLAYTVDGKAMEDKTPFSFVSASGKELPISYKLKGNVVSFAGFNANVVEDLIIDPVLDWSTFFPGVYGGYQGDPCVDSQGNIYVSTQEGGSTFPVLNAGSGQWYQNASAGPSPNPDVVIFKFNSSYALEWATYYGGQDYDNAWGKRNVTIDEVNSSIYISGQTEHVYSNGVQNFPTMNPGGGAFYQDATTYGNKCPFFIKLSTSGVRQWATLFNYETGLPAAQSMGINIQSIYFRNGKLYFAGQTNKYSTSGIPLRTLAGGYNNSFFVGNITPFVGRFSTAGVLEWCSYVDASVASTSFFGNVADMVVDANNNMYVVTDYMEYSSSKLNTILPLVNPGGGAYFQNTAGLGYASRRGTHITKLNPASSSVLWGTFYCGGYGDLPGGCEIDINNNFYVVWRSAQSNDFPTMNPGGGAYYQSTRRSVSNTAPGDYANGGCDGAIAKFSPAGARLWATYMNGTTPTSASTSLNDVDCYPNGDIIISGSTGTTDFPTLSVAGSYNKSTLTTAGTSETVFTKFSTGGVIQWSTYFNNIGNYSYGAIQNTNCSQKYIVDGGGNAAMPVVNPGGGAYYNTTTNGYQSFHVFSDANASSNSTAATSISTSAAAICSGATTTLTLNGGSLASGATWQWYTGSCGGTSAGSGTSISVSPSSATTYYVRAEGTCNTTTCSAVTINVNSSSSAASSINASSSTICSGASVTLSVNGGSLGTAANWQWYSASCGGTAVGTGASIVVSPGSTTTYYVRAEGSCNNTSCVSTVINVNSNSAAPTSINPSTSTICSGNNTTLNVSGGSLGTGASWQWFSGSCGGTSIGSGTSISVSPGTATTYYVYAAGTCNTTSCASTIINVNSNSTAPTGVTNSVPTICPGGNTTLSVSGGSLGSGASWQWFTGGCGGTAAGTGNSISVSPGSTTTYYVYATGTCNTTSCANTVVNVNSNSTAPTSINTTTSTICPGGNTTLSVNGGALGTAANWQWYSGSCGGTAAGSGNSITVSPGAATTYFVRAEGTCNNTSCVSTVINLNTTSSAPSGITTTTTTICPGNNTTLTVNGGSLGSGANWQWFTGSCNGTSAGSGSSITVSPGSATTYYVNATGSCNTTACSNVAINVSSNSTAATSINTTTNTVCSGGNTTLSVNGGALGTAANWQWYSGSCGGTLVGSGSSITVSPTSATTYYVRAEGACGNTGCVSVVINVNSNSAAPTSITTTSTTVCSGSNNTLTVSGGSLGAGANWQWFTGSCTGTSAGSGSSITVSPTSPTTYYVKAVGTCNSTTCSSVTINVNSVSTSPSSINASSAAICSGTSSTLTVTGGSLGTGGAWNWYANGCGTTLVGTGPTLTVSPAITTAYFVRAEGSCGNSLCAQVTVSVTTTPSATWLSPGTICTGSGVLNLSSLVTGNTGGTWSGTGVTGTSFDPAALAGQTIPVSYSVVNGFCSDVVTHSISVASSVSANWNSPGGLCASGGTVNLSSYVTGSTGGTWTGSGVSGTTLNPIALSGPVAITYSVGSGSCSDSKTYTINVTPAASANWTTPGTLCASNGTVNLTTYLSGTSGGTWTGTGVTGNIFDPSALAGQIVLVNYQVGNVPCVASVSHTIQVVNVGNAAFNLPLTICENASNLNLNTLVTGNPGGIFTGTGVTTNTFNPSGLAGQSIVITYTVGASPCGAAQSKTITVTSAPLTPSVAVSSATICAGLSTTISATGSGGGAVYTVYASPNGVGTLGATPVALSPSVTTTYYLQSFSGGCSNMGGDVPFTITVNPTPVVNAGTDQNVCLGSSVTLTATGGGSYVWSNGVTTSTNVVSPSVNTSYTVVVTNSNSCVGQDVVNVSVITAGSLQATDDHTSVQSNQSVTTNVASNDTGNPNTVSIVSGPLHGSATVGSNGTIIYTPNDGYVGVDTVYYSICDVACGLICKNAKLVIDVTKEIVIVIPGGFSPNGDGLNDKFEVVGLENFPDNELVIFNRWGDEVFKAAPYKNDWNGQSEGKGLTLYGSQLVEGTYFYILILDKTSKPYKGYVELKRK